MTLNKFTETLIVKTDKSGCCDWHQWSGNEWFNAGQIFTGYDEEKNRQVESYDEAKDVITKHLKKYGATTVRFKTK